MIGQQLQWDGEDEGVDEVVGLGEANDRDAFSFVERHMEVGEDIELTAAGADFLEIGL